VPADCAGLPALLLAALLASCAPPAPPQQKEVVPSQPLACHVGPDGGPVASEAGQRTADRGIGGTGVAGSPVVADRGIGGTGIVAVITGFASVCLGGQEVALDPNVPVVVGDQAASASALRAGQVALIDAGGTGSALRARRITVRYEVVGPVETVDGETLRVAGQQVHVTATTWGDRPAVRDWVAVSGLRRPDGTIEATRLDRRNPGKVVVHGRLVQEGKLFRIGTLLIRAVPGVPALAGRYVTVVGQLDADVLSPEQIVPDLLASDPAALFSASVSVLLVETFAEIADGHVHFSQGFSAAAPSFGASGPRRAVLTLERGDGGLRAVNLQSEAGHGQGIPGSAMTPSQDRGAAPRQFEPAPVPDRTLGGAGGDRRSFNGSPARNGVGRSGRRSGEYNGSDEPGGSTGGMDPLGRPAPPSGTGRGW
jgi:uncharacterized protein DUF5666